MSGDTIHELEGQVEIEIDLLFSLLSHPLRRDALMLVRDTDRMAFRDLCEALARMSAERHGVPLTQQVIDDTGVSLHHRHLPKLSRAGMLEYDPDARRVIRRDVDESVYAVLDAVGWS